MQTHSPWLQELTPRSPYHLTGDRKADVCIVGGGIAGISTAYYLLRDTSHSVLLLDAKTIARGATGHNAGEVVGYFERHFSDIVGQYGLHLAAQAQNAVESAWMLLEGILHETKIPVPYYRVPGYFGYSTIEQVLAALEDDACRIAAGFRNEPILLAEESGIARQLKPAYTPLHAAVPRAAILSLLETDDPRYIACAYGPKACMNTALFCEELAAHLLRAYPERFAIAEDMPVRRIALTEKAATLHAGDRTFAVSRVILCTNGFEDLTVENPSDPTLDTLFHRRIEGVVGYMVGYLDQQHRPPVILNYLRESDEQRESYHYLARRPFRVQTGCQLTTLGGHDRWLRTGEYYERAATYPQEEYASLGSFLTDTYRHTPARPDFTFRWHGLMGYTPSGIRCIGQEPRNPVLLYNLGCNGVGILPSVYGGKRIAAIVNGVALPRSLFDPSNELFTGPKGHDPAVW